MKRRYMAAMIVAGVVAAIAAGIAVGFRRQQRELAARIHELVQAAATAPAMDSSELVDRLPPPVIRYLRRALPQSRPVRVVRMRQVGTLRTDVGTDRWMTFEAEHTAAPDAVGFVWNARVTVAPLIHVRVRDAFFQGEGSGHVSLFSAITMASNSGTPEMNSGSLHRFLAEAVWYPTALLPGPNLRWSQIDSNTALATLTAHGTSVSLEFRFRENGDVTGIYTPARWGAFGGGYEQHPWEGHFRNYQFRQGLLVPSEGDVGWYLDGVWRPVWKGTITEFDAY
jgi:hypothetical protein